MNRNILRSSFAAAVLAVLLFSCPIRAQEQANKPAAAAPAATQTTPAPAATKTTPEAAAAAAAEKAKARLDQLKNDWASLSKYKEADLKLGPPAEGEKRVVFMGDSITYNWHLDQSFPGKPYINRGINGQTSQQMLVRFRQDVIDLKPKVVVILAGFNDIAGNTGPTTPEQIVGYIASMAELATANHIRVVLCSTTPSFDFSWHPGAKLAPKVMAINELLKAYAAQKHYVYVDYHSALKDERGGLPPSLSKDEVHPNAAGYAIMAPLVEAGIKKAMRW